MLRLKRAYEQASRTDGQRILVERLWPRGVTKARAKIDLWMKEIAPSTELRKWFGHEPVKWNEFCRRYWKELQSKPELVTSLRQMIRGKNVTFIYAAHDERQNGAVALKAFLSRRASSKTRRRAVKSSK